MPVPLDELLTAARILCQAECGSKKRVLELVAGLVAGGNDPEMEDQLCASFNARERLGSTGIGSGIAIPHCRLSSCPRPLAALMTLQKPVDFAAIDDQPVDIVFALVVPDGATDEHLQLLARLAEMFSRAGPRAAMRAARSGAELLQVVLGAWEAGDKD
jgi:nitrogen PTS system EIIA component